MSKTLIDANIILRILLDDNPALTALAEKQLLLQPNNSYILTAAVLAEIIYVMKGAGYERDQAPVAVADLMQYRQLAYDEPCLVHNLELYRTTNMDFVDCYLLARAVSKREQIATLDKQIQKTYQQLAS